MYIHPPLETAIDQGDIIDDCPLVALAGFPASQPEALEVKFAFERVVVLTQTCDQANEKAPSVVVAQVIVAARLVADGLLKAADVRGGIRAGRVHGWYFLPASSALGLPESLVDLRQLHTVRLDVLQQLCRLGKRRAHIQPLYREHLARHFAETYARIGLPEVYPTE